MVSPPILCIQVKRFTYNGDKIKSTVRINYEIDLAKYIIFIILNLYIVI